MTYQEFLRNMRLAGGPLAYLGTDKQNDKKHDVIFKGSGDVRTASSEKIIMLL